MRTKMIKAIKQKHKTSNNGTNNCVHLSKQSKMSQTHSLVRQLFVAGAPQLAAVSVGGAFTYPSILLMQLSANDTSIVLDFDTASWIGSIHGLSGIPSILMPVIMQWRGRKLAFIIACLMSIIGWILAFRASSTMTLLISESFHGLGNSCVLGVSLLSISEMVAPRFRNVSMVSYPLMQGVGMTICGIIGRYLHWKTVGIVLCVPVMVAMLMSCMWPESPSWLAYKGKFEECETAFTWLRGEGEHDMKELQELINAQKENLVIKGRKANSLKYSLRTFLNRSFYLPCFHVFVLLHLLYSCGSMVIIIYCVKVIESSTKNENAAYYGSILVNFVLFIGVGVSAFLVRRFPNKLILLLSVIGVVITLSLVALSSYLQVVGILPKESMIGFVFLVLYVIFLSFGILPISLTMAAELIPVKHRGIGGAMYVIFTSILHSLLLKTAPYLFKYITFWGTMLLYAVNASICGVYVWKYVPETKGRTLQELEDYYTHRNVKDVCVSNKQTERLNPS